MFEWYGTRAEWDATPRPEIGNAMSQYETVDYREENGVAWVTLNRPDVYNAFNRKMQRELHDVWRSLPSNPDVRCAVLTGAGGKSFSTGIDRDEAMGATDEEFHYDDAFLHYDDPGNYLGPKSSGCWVPVIGAVNGMACGGAFYMLGECDFLIAAEHATFFDPHVTYGMVASYETIHMAQRMPLGELLRMQLLGAHERLSAQRAHEIGLVSEVVPGPELEDRARWAAETIAARPRLAIQGTVRAAWASKELGRSQALELGNAFLALGRSDADIEEGQRFFTSGGRVEPRVR